MEKFIKELRSPVHSVNFDTKNICLVLVILMFIQCESYDYDKGYSKGTNKSQKDPQSNIIPKKATSSIDQAGQSVVQVVAKYAYEAFASSGSGSIIDPYHILTNYHVINNSGGISTEIEVWLANPDLTQPPVQYVKGVVQVYDESADLAIIKTRTKIPRNHLEITGERYPKAGGQITIIGFPSLGSNTITFTQGIVSGFMNLNGVDLIKTDCEVNRGNSGGIAIDENNQIVGVPTAVNIDADTGGRLGLIVPAKYCVRLIHKSKD